MEGGGEKHGKKHVETLPEGDMEEKEREGETLRGEEEKPPVSKHRGRFFSEIKGRGREKSDIPL